MLDHTEHLLPDEAALLENWAEISVWHSAYEYLPDDIITAYNLLPVLLTRLAALRRENAALRAGLESIDRKYPPDWYGVALPPTGNDYAYTERDMAHQRSLLMGWEAAGHIARRALESIESRQR